MRKSFQSLCRISRYLLPFCDQENRLYADRQREPLKWAENVIWCSEIYIYFLRIWGLLWWRVWKAQKFLNIFISNFQKGENGPSGLISLTKRLSGCLTSFFCLTTVYIRKSHWCRSKIYFGDPKKYRLRRNSLSNKYLNRKSERDAYTLLGATELL